jgi:hypothetical protein
LIENLVQDFVDALINQDALILKIKYRVEDKLLEEKKINFFNKRSCQRYSKLEKKLFLLFN